MDDKEAWPYLVERRLSKVYPNIWVGNAGINGLTLKTQENMMENLLNSSPKLDMLIILSGINDLARNLQGENKSVNNSHRLKLKLIDSLRRSATITLAKKLIGIFYQIGDKTIASHEIIKEMDRTYIYRRHKRLKARCLLKELPKLNGALSEYAKNINKIIDIANNKGLRLVFLTQPTIWKLQMNEVENQLIWFGWKGDLSGEFVDYYSVEALTNGIFQYNNVLKTVCTQRKIEYIDLASLMPRDTTVFYDDAHFNEKGAELVAEIVSTYLLNNKLIH